MLDSLRRVKLFGRKLGADRDRGASNGVAVAEPEAGRFAGSDEELLAEIERLTERERAGASVEIERDLIGLRNQAGLRRLHAARDGAGFPDPAGVQLREGPLPEFSPQELTPELIRAAFLRDGCLFVRGLIPRERAIEFAQHIDRSFAEREQYDTGQPHDAAFYDEFKPFDHVGEDLGRPWIKEGGGVLAVDSPLLNFEMTEILGEARMPELVRGYLGEPVLTTAHKTTLRKAEPSVPGGWHQDGRFMGKVRSLNLWLALSRCGDVAPGLDIVPRRFDDFVTTQTDEALLDYMISQRMAEEAAGETPIMRPIFEPGDALLFDDMFLHKTGSDPAMPEPRFALENWFFGASGFPDGYAPIAV
jgi:hypothetical protein